MTTTIRGTDNSAAAPALTGNDPDTGIYFPAADTIALSAGGAEKFRAGATEVVVNDTGADVDFRVEGDTDANLLFVDASADKVGIGTNTPSASGLEISKATGSATPTPVELRLATTTTASDWSTTDPWGRLSFYSADASGSGPKIHGAIDAVASTSTGGASTIEFKVNLDGSDTLTKTLEFVGGTTVSSTVFYSGAEQERMRITSAGEVLVGGTTSVATYPSSAISIQGSTSSYAELALFRNDTDIGGGNTLGRINFLGNDTTSNTPTNLAYIAAVASNTHSAGDNPTDIVFGTTPVGSATVDEIFRINSAGILELKNGSYPTLIYSNYQNCSVGVATTIFTISAGSSGVVFISSPDPSLSTTRYQANVYFARGSGTPVIVTDENIDSLSAVTISLSGNDIQITSSNASMDRFVASVIYSYYAI